MSDTTDYLEREIENHRANVENTLERLKDRLSVNKVVDDIGQFVGIDDVPGALSGAGQKLRDNPIALGLIGAGVAWLLLGGSSGRPEHAKNEHRRDWPKKSHAPSEMYGNRAMDEVEEKVEEVSSRVGDAAHNLRNRATDLAESAKHATSHAAKRVNEGYDSVRHRAEPITDTVSRYPLLIGAAALVAGAVIGSALPRTRTEDRYLSGTRDRLVDEAKSAARDVKAQAVSAAKDARERVVETAKDVKSKAVGAAQDVYAAAHDRAEKEGLLPDPVGQLTDKLGKVAKSAIDEAQEQIEPVVEAAKDEIAAHTSRKRT